MTVPKNRAIVLRTVLTLIALPLALVVLEAASFYRANRSSGTMVIAGQRREYLLHVPASYDRTKPTPLVISLHGAAGWGAQQMRVSRWNDVADRDGFIVVYPSALKRVGPRIWHVERGPGLPRDIAFIAALIDTLEATYNIDPAMVYANGLSNGGGMSFALSCTLSDRIAAVGMVAAAQTLPWRWCTDRRPVPMVTFHGTADPMIPYNGGASWTAPDAFPNVLLWTRSWAQRNRCDPTPRDSTVAADVTRQQYGDCADGADVVLYTVHGGGHTWPGGEPLPEWAAGRTSRSIDASSVMWTFFQQHRLSGSRGTPQRR